ncbi:unnamed protein product, partial [Owenia fusiformis]
VCEHSGQPQGTMANLDSSNAIVTQPLGHNEQGGRISNTPGDIIVGTPNDSPEHECTTGTTLSNVVSDVVVRAIEEGDAEFVGRLEMESFRSKYEWAVGKNRVEELATIRQNRYREICDKNCRVFIAEYKNNRAGMLIIKFHGYKAQGSSTCYFRERLGCSGACGYTMLLMCMESTDIDPADCYIDCICVDKEHRGKGIGNILMDRAEHEAKAMGCSKMTLYVAQNNRAVSLYQRQGYHIFEDADGCCCAWCAFGIRKWYGMSKMI